MTGFAGRAALHRWAGEEEAAAPWRQQQAEEAEVRRLEDLAYGARNPYSTFRSANN
jgi:hypothetical protein